MAHVDKYYDNSLDNIGRGNSFVWYGCRWAQATTATVGTISITVQKALVMILLPSAFGGDDDIATGLEIAGLKHPDTYKGRQISPLRGRSWVRFLSLVQSTGSGGGRTEIHDRDYVMGFEIAGSGALRRGDWKITFVPAPKGPQRWELFVVKDDPGEVYDLAKEFPDLLEKMLKLWQEYKHDVGSIGVAGEYETGVQEDARTTADEMDDPYAWIKYIGRPEITPGRSKNVVPFIA
ncbi:putative Alkaline-phosphatase-like protein [Seiridium cardinale]